MLSVLLSAAIAAPEPCTGHVFDQRVSSDHFWVEWEGDLLTRDQAEAIAGYAEQAREVYLELGWPLTDEAIVYAVLPAEGSGMGGLAQTGTCEGEIVPEIELYLGEYSEERALNLTAHELGHGAEYGYMGDYLDSVQSWLWWMEGTATWLAAQVDGDEASWAYDAEAYLRHPELGLHQDLTAFLYADRSNHMYGTAILASFLEERAGGSDTVRETWAFGGPRTGEAIYFPEAIESVGLDFDALWAEWLARSTQVAQAWGGAVDHGAARLAIVGELPAAGSPDFEQEPQGLGFNVVAFSNGLGGRSEALEVTFEGDPEVDWTVVLVRAFDTWPGSPVLEYVSLEVQDGQGEGWLSGFDRSSWAFLVVSPHAPDLAGHAWSWSADAVDDPGAMEGTVVLAEGPEGCGCAASSPRGLSFGLWVLLGGLVPTTRARRPAARSGRCG